MTRLATSVVDAGATVDWSSIATPPRFIHEPNNPVLYFKVEKHGTEQTKTPDNLFQITINCVAASNPSSSYRWTKTEKPSMFICIRTELFRNQAKIKFVDLSSKIDDVTDIPYKALARVDIESLDVISTLVFSKLDESDAGSYQCEASNDNGTAVSSPTRLEQTCTFSK
ncbi:hypothetical protein DICVIV_10863 [Dictyocaulus viviparus]|uniref:Ig-like domain-containing protein n=1 Tax=Dictyocaulus viviparus TaxID=29172 RepID=A0A0D8XHD5_DICVI|nr:hypothetical protein DICVIV_10863 [Dictyocaulus viviparus]